ncbi:hypothetical protein MMC16_001948 [Acarospora aff. strigata]|nr:hypothetical protein [Acarospora aff. strigata]
MAATVSPTVVAIMAAPKGYVLDFENPQRKGDTVGYWVAGVGMVLSFFFLCMRVYIKGWVKRKFDLADACYVLAWAFGITVQSILIHLWAVKAQGVHAYEIPVHRYNYFSIMIMIASLLYVPCLGLAKVSLLLCYHQFALGKVFKFMVYAVMVVVVGYSFAIIIALIFPCVPIAKNWDITITKGTCLNRAAIYIATAAVNIATDVTLLLLPIPIVVTLQMRRMRKVSVVFVFALGSMTCITSIIRLVGILPMLVNPDQTWAVSVPCIWICVEANLVIICGSFPTLRLFFNHVAPKSIGESGSGSNSQSWRKNTGPQTISSQVLRERMSSRLTYGRMTGGDKDTEMDTMWENNRKTQRANDDGGSETAILQTKTTTIEYSAA